MLIKLREKRKADGGKEDKMKRRRDDKDREGRLLCATRGHSHWVDVGLSIPIDEKWERVTQRCPRCGAQRDIIRKVRAR